MPVSDTVDRLRAEQESLMLEKKKIERELSDIEAWKCGETAEILSKRFPKSLSVEKTNRLESEYRQKRSPILVRLHSAEERLHAIKSRLRTKVRNDFQAFDDERRAQTGILREMLSVLKDIANKLDQER